MKAYSHDAAAAPAALRAPELKRLSRKGPASVHQADQPKGPRGARGTVRSGTPSIHAAARAAGIHEGRIKVI